MIRLVLSLLHTALYAIFGHILYPFLFIARERISWWYFSTYSRILFRLNGVRVVAEGAGQVDPSRPHLVVSNHQSLFDIPVLMAVLPLDMRFFAKRELRWVPLFGTVMLLYGDVLVDRADTRGAVDALRRGKAFLARRSLVLFPEGTRSPDGKVHPFKTGGFSLATDTGTPVLPVAIRGSGDILPKKALFPRPGTIHVKVFPPVAAAAGDDRKALAARLEGTIRSFVEPDTQGGTS